MSLWDSPNQLAALGILQSWCGRMLSAEQVEPELRRLFDAALTHENARPAALSARIDPTSSRELNLSASTRRDLERLWRQMSNRLRPKRASGWLYHGLRLRIEGLPAVHHGLDLALRLRKAAKVDAVSTVDRRADGRSTWRWPLRIAVPKESGQLLTALRSYRYRRLVSIVDLSRDGAEFDLLLVDRAGMEALLPRSEERASFVVILADAVDQQALQASLALADRLRTSGVAVVEPSGVSSDFLAPFIDSLSHDRTLDLAVAEAAGDAPYSIVGDPDFLDRSRISRSIAGMRSGIERGYVKGTIQHVSFDRALDEFEALGQRVRSGGYDSEGGAATEAARSVQRVEEISGGEAVADAAEGESNERWLQYQVFQHRDGDLIRRKDSFAADAKHLLRARIGRSNVEWGQLDRQFPDQQLPPDESEHRLTIVLSAPGLLDEPQTRTVLLQPGSDSAPTEFDLVVPPDARQIDISLRVLYRNKTLQTARLAGAVGEFPAGAKHLEFQAGEPVALDLELNQGADLAVWKDGDWLHSRIGEGETRHVYLAGIAQAVDEMVNRLHAAATGAEQLDQDLGHGTALKFLVDLAFQGRYLRSKIFPDAGGSAELDAVATVHCPSPSASDFVPIEFLYDYALPAEDAKLCPSFASASAGGTCACSGLDPKIVCPTGFWAVRRVIERQLVSERLNGERPPEPNREHPHLEPARSVIFAASHQVDADQVNTISGTLDSLREFTGDHLHEAVSWKEWRDLVASEYPAILVALPHNVVGRGRLRALQISADQDLSLAEIREDVIRPAGRKPGPIVLLLGCHTAHSQIAYEDFVADLRNHGAAVVVGTLSKIIGHRAAPVAVGLVRRIWEDQKDPGLTFGETIRRARGEILRQGNLIGLTLTAFGNCDWRLAAQEA